MSVVSYASTMSWPNPPFEIALIEPEIPPNTGNIARLCAGTSTPLHLVGPLGFQTSDRAMKRAGLDYWDSVDLREHVDLENFLETMKDRRLFFLSTRGTQNYTEISFNPGDVLVFGSETRGLSEKLLAENKERVLTIPMKESKVRSLNLANSVGIVLYEALRQVNG